MIDAVDSARGTLPGPAAHEALNGDMIPAAEAARRLNVYPKAIRDRVRNRGLKHEYCTAPDARGHLHRQLFVSWKQLQTQRQRFIPTEYEGDMIPAAEAARRLNVYPKVIRDHARNWAVRHEYRTAPDARGYFRRQFFVSWAEFERQWRAFKTSPVYDGDMIPAAEAARRLGRSLTTIYSRVRRGGLKHEYRNAQTARGLRKQLFVSWAEFQPPGPPLYDGDMIPATEAARRLGISPQSVGYWAAVRGVKHEYRKAPSPRGGPLRRHLFVSWEELVTQRRASTRPVWDGDMIPAAEAARRLNVSVNTIHHRVKRQGLKREYRTAPDSRGRLWRQLFVSWPELQRPRRSRPSRPPVYEGDMIPVSEAARRLKLPAPTMHSRMRDRGFTRRRRKAPDTQGRQRLQWHVSWTEAQAFEPTSGSMRPAWDGDMIPAAEAARRLGVSPSTIRYRVRARGIKHEWCKARNARGYLRRQLFLSWAELTGDGGERTGPIDQAAPIVTKANGEAAAVVDDQVDETTDQGRGEASIDANTNGESAGDGRNAGGRPDTLRELRKLVKADFDANPSAPTSAMDILVAYRDKFAKQIKAGDLSHGSQAAVYKMRVPIRKPPPASPNGPS